MDISRHREFMVSRVLNLGDEESVRWLLSIVSREEVIDIVKNSRSLSPKTLTCWENILGLREEIAKCS